MCGTSNIGGAISGYMDQRALNRAIDYNANVLAKNIDFLNIQAEEALEQGDKKALIKGLKVRGLLGAQKAEYGASGIDATRGSPLMVMFDTRKMAEIDMMTIRYNALNQWKKLKFQAFDTQAQIDLMKAQKMDPWAAAGLGGLGGGGGGYNFGNLLSGRDYGQNNYQNYNANDPGPLIEV